VIPILFLIWCCGPKKVMTSSFMRFLDHTQRRTRFCSTPLYEWSVHRRDLCLKTDNTHNTQTSIFPAGFEPTTSAVEWPQTCVLDRADTGIGVGYSYICFFSWRYTTHSGCVFYSPVSGFSLLAYEVTWSHTTTHHSR
jgi:hypothetical protein